MPLFRRRTETTLRVPGLSTDPPVVGQASYPAAPGQLWLVDLAVGETKAGLLYLAAVLDCYSRYCLGWATARQLDPRVVNDAVRSAVASRGDAHLSAAGLPGEIALALSPRCRVAGISVPDGSEPSPIDAAVAESFFSMLSRDFAGSRIWLTRSGAAEAISGWIDGAYNRGRFASPLRAGA
jgi:putative transposase